MHHYRHRPDYIRPAAPYVPSDNYRDRDVPPRDVGRIVLRLVCAVLLLLFLAFGIVSLVQISRINHQPAADTWVTPTTYGPPCSPQPCAVQA